MRNPVDESDRPGLCLGLLFMSLGISELFISYPITLGSEGPQSTQLTEGFKLFRFYFVRTWLAERALRLISFGFVVIMLDLLHPEALMTVEIMMCPMMFWDALAT